MSFDSLLHALLPRDGKFLNLLKKDVENLLSSAQIFKTLMSNKITAEERDQKIKKLEELEHKGDEITHQIYNELGLSFITPFDREDIHELTSKLDDVLDAMQGAATRISLYRVKKISPEQEQLAALVYDAVVELHRALPGLGDLKNASKMKEALVKIHSIENESDDLFERAIADLFEKCKDPILLIKTKELLVGLETATDRCEDAANVINGIIVKNA